MKKILFCIYMVSLPLILHGDDIVNIWADNHSQDLGVSTDRVWLKSYFLSNFEYYTTLRTERSSGALTAVTASRELYFLLDELLKFEDSYSEGSCTISKSDNIYTFINSDISLEISFSLEKPGKEIFQVINSVYDNDNTTRKEVTDHYLQSWVIRIHSAENVVSPDVNTLDYDDILISATIIGEKFQWLWGVHDGVDYIYNSFK